jgi:hypothetical protein
MRFQVEKEVEGGREMVADGIEAMNPAQAVARAAPGAGRYRVYAVDRPCLALSFSVPAWGPPSRLEE